VLRQSHERKQFVSWFLTLLEALLQHKILENLERGLGLPEKAVFVRLLRKLGIYKLSCTGVVVRSVLELAEGPEEILSPEVVVAVEEEDLSR